MSSENSFFKLFESSSTCMFFFTVFRFDTMRSSSSLDWSLSSSPSSLSSCFCSKFASLPLTDTLFPSFDVDFDTLALLALRRDDGAACVILITAFDELLVR